MLLIAGDGMVRDDSTSDIPLSSLDCVWQWENQGKVFVMCWVLFACQTGVFWLEWFKGSWDPPPAHRVPQGNECKFSGVHSGIYLVELQWVVSSLGQHVNWFRGAPLSRHPGIFQGVSLIDHLCHWCWCALCSEGGELPPTSLWEWPVEAVCILLLLIYQICQWNTYPCFLRFFSSVDSKSVVNQAPKWYLSAA